MSTKIDWEEVGLMSTPSPFGTVEQLELLRRRLLACTPSPSRQLRGLEAETPWRRCCGRRCPTYSTIISTLWWAGASVPPIASSSASGPR